MTAFVDTLLKKEDKEGALEVIRNAIRDLVCDRVPIEDLILSKKLSKMHYKTLVPHLQVRKDILAREPSRVPLLGDRIPYVVASGLKGEKASICPHYDHHCAFSNISFIFRWPILHEILLFTKRTV